MKDQSRYTIYDMSDYSENQKLELYRSICLEFQKNNENHIDKAIFYQDFQDEIEEFKRLEEYYPEYKDQITKRKRKY